MLKRKWQKGSEAWLMLTFRVQKSEEVQMGNTPEFLLMLSDQCFQ